MDAIACDREISDLFPAIRDHVELDQTGPLLARNRQRYLCSALEMTALFRDIPGAVENTVDLTSHLTFQLDDLGYEFLSSLAGYENSRHFVLAATLVVINASLPVGAFGSILLFDAL